VENRRGCPFTGLLSLSLSLAPQDASAAGGRYAGALEVVWCRRPRRPRGAKVASWVGMVWAWQVSCRVSLIPEAAVSESRWSLPNITVPILGRHIFLNRVHLRH
jgi:hypothetical protein